MIDEIEIQEAKDWIKVQLSEIDPNTRGIITFTYGTEDYIVSGNTVKKIAEKTLPKLNEKFPNILFLFLPFYITISDELKNLEELK